MARPISVGKVSGKPGWLYVATPYDKDYVEALKALNLKAWWNPAKKIWLVEESALDAVKHLLRRFFSHEIDGFGEPIDASELESDKEAGAAAERNKTRAEIRNLQVLLADREAEIRRLRDEVRALQQRERFSKRHPFQADFEVLELDCRARKSVIKAAYKALAFDTHPDRGGDAAAFRRVNEAYERLSK